MIGVARTPCRLLVLQGSSLDLGVHCPESYQNSQEGTHINNTLATERGPLESLQRLYVCDIANTLGSRPTTEHRSVTLVKPWGPGGRAEKSAARNKAGALRAR